MLKMLAAWDQALHEAMPSGMGNILHSFLMMR